MYVSCLSPLISNSLFSFWKGSEQYQRPKGRKPLREVVTIKTMLPCLFRAITMTMQQQVSTLMRSTQIWSQMLILTQPCMYFLRLKGYVPLLCSFTIQLKHDKSASKDCEGRPFKSSMSPILGTWDTICASWRKRPEQDIQRVRWLMYANSRRENAMGFHSSNASYVVVIGACIGFWLMEYRACARLPWYNRLIRFEKQGPPCVRT